MATIGEAVSFEENAASSTDASSGMRPYMGRGVSAQRSSVEASPVCDHAMGACARTVTSPGEVGFCEGSVSAWAAPASSVSGDGVAARRSSKSGSGANSGSGARSGSGVNPGNSPNSGNSRALTGESAFGLSEGRVCASSSEPRRRSSLLMTCFYHAASRWAHAGYASARTMRTLASAATPSPRPVKPR